MDMIYDATNFVAEHKFWFAALAPFVIGYVVIKILS